MRLLRALLGFDLVPDSIHVACAASASIAEHMRMPADHLPRHALDDIAERERAGFFRHARVIDDLQQQIAEFVLEISHIAPLDGVCDLIGFFDRVRRDRLECLFEIPRAAGLRRSQPRHDLDQPRNVARRLYAVRHYHPREKSRGD